MSDKPLWQPSAARTRSTHLAAFSEQARKRWGLKVADYGALHRWSVTEPAQFWQSVWAYCDVIGDRLEGPALENGNRMPGARWFPDARLNFAENLLRRRDRATAIVFWGETRLKTTVTYAEL